MKRASVAAAALLLASCGPVQEKEPNDHFTQATPASPGRSVKGVIGASSDVDVYKLEVSKPGILDLHVGGIRDCDFVLSFQDKDRVELKRADDTAVGGDEGLLDLGLDPGTYFVALSNKNPKYQAGGQAYELELGARAPGASEREPDDRPAQASELAFGGVTRGHYQPARNPLAEGEAEEDWYRVKIADPGVYLLNLDVSEVPKVDPVLEVYDANGYKIKDADANGTGLGESLRNFGVRGPVEYAVRLRPKGGGANAEVPYELVTELLPYQGGTELEPNDQRSEATPFEAARMEGKIAQPGDADWYQVTVGSDTKQLLRAELSPVAGMDLQLAVMDEVGNPILTVDNMGKDQPEVLTGLGVSGVVYLVVSEKSGKKADARGGYTLAKWIEPASPGLEYELNDSTRTAQALKVGESVDAFFAPKGDQDLYEFNVYQKAVLVFEATGVVNVRPGFAVFDQDGAEKGAAAAKKPSDAVVLELELEPGTYLARLRPEDAGQANSRDKYTFRIRAR